MTTLHKYFHEIPPMNEDRAKELENISDEAIDYSDIPPWMKNFSKQLSESTENQKRNCDRRFNNLKISDRYS